MNVALIFGGNSTEHDISVISGVEALNAMPVRGVRTLPLYLREGKWYTGTKLYDVRFFCAFDPARVMEVRIAGKEVLRKGRLGWKPFFTIDVALLATHGGEGEDGALQGFLEVNGIPYTTSSVAQSAVCMDKCLTKTVLSAYGIPVVRGKTLFLPAEEEDVAALEAELGYPMIVKPAAQGSSIGITMANDRDGLHEGLTLAAHFGEKALVEKGLKGFTELNVAAFSMRGKLLLSEIERPLTAGDFLSFGEKYLNGEKGASPTGREFPAKLDEPQREIIFDIARKVYEILGLFGVVRMDFIKTEEGIFLNEVNTVPGSLAHYLFTGFSYPALLRAMAEEGIERGTPVRAVFSSEVLTRISLDGSVKRK